VCHRPDRSHDAPRDEDADGRWVIETRFRRRQWEVVVEPIPEKKILEVVTAYPRWED